MWDSGRKWGGHFRWVVVCVCVYVGDKVRDINIDRMIEILCHVQ